MSMRVPQSCLHVVFFVQYHQRVCTTAEGRAQSLLAESAHPSAQGKGPQLISFPGEILVHSIILRHVVYCTFNIWSVTVTQLSQLRSQTEKEASLLKWLSRGWSLCCFTKESEVM